MTTSTSLTQAIETFVHGFGFTRSFTHPYVGEKIIREMAEPLWVIRDAPRKNKKYRTEEWVGIDVPPTEFDSNVREQTRGKFAICTILRNGEPDEAMRAEYRTLGYRLVATEPLMVHPLENIPTFDELALIERVSTLAQAERVNKAARSRQVLPEHLPPAHSPLAHSPPAHSPDKSTLAAFLQMPIRQYIALIDDELVGRVASIPIETSCGPTAWVSNMYVAPEFRRRGIARSLLSRMLYDDRDAGTAQSILLASHTGAKLYPIMGYKQIGMLYIYSPKSK